MMLPFNRITSAELVRNTSNKTGDTVRDALNNSQSLNTLLSAIAALNMAADQYIYGTGTDTVALGTITAFARSLLNDASGAAAFDTMGAAQSLSTAGYQKLPSGMIIQWGAASGGAGGTNVSFPTAFTTSAPRMAGACWTKDRTFAFSSFSTTGFHLDIRTIGGADSATTLSWIAAGY